MHHFLHRFCFVGTLCVQSFIMEHNFFLPLMVYVISVTLLAIVGSSNHDA